MTCAVCGERFGDTFTVREMMYGTGEEFTYAQCVGCRSLWLLEPPEDMGPYYDSGSYYSFDAEAKRPGFWDVYRWTKNRAFHVLAARDLPWPKRLSAPAYMKYGVDAMTPKARILDVGCGSGSFLRELRRCGFTRLTGLDPFLPPDTAIGGVDLIRGDWDQVTGQFDVIMMHHSLEHTPDPVQALRGARERLTAGGSIIVRIPVVAEAWQRYGVNWVQLDAPRHMVLLTLEGVAALAEAAELGIVNSYCDSSAFQFWGSELYERDIPLIDPRAPGPNGSSGIFSREQMQTWSREAQELNGQMRGDQAVFVLKRS